ncbi:hypothetical protein [Xanthomonas citri]|uniref:hypothetical protein n=1 Tax=Xanthomonas citri TaxID=346 RepID=UPI0008A697BD|nr:hypothetical protein [Xanthomonas citri]AOY62057.1 hypothetical protein BHE84_07790 [Xanthomonas citri pv. glycines str. 8ra]ARV24260.1 hypothetical protein A9D66_17055 [Xanthomonas citri pv. glycines str. 12-2]QDR46320.1 hypothetical protein FPK90_17960 [Xanthomonas citri pv. glycines]QDS21311.1 hypothetical protein FPL05_17590 [Xanthomonas citri pv. glycines]
MKFVLVSVLYLCSMALSHAACRTEPINTNLPGLGQGLMRDQVQQVFPTYREIVPSSDRLAIVWIDPKDCGAKDIDARQRQLETMLGRQVILMPSPQDYRILQGDFGYPEIVKTRQLRALFPTLRIRGSKIGENVEVLVVGESDLAATELDDRLGKAATIVGRPVELRTDESATASK